MHELPKEQQPLLELFSQEAAKQGYTAYVVGGFVRDSLLRSATAQHNDQPDFLDTSFLDIDIVLHR